jgi:hypothetical protein
MTKLQVARHRGRKRDRGCQSTDFWYSSMRAIGNHDLARRDLAAKMKAIGNHDLARRDVPASNLSAQHHKYAEQS